MAVTMNEIAKKLNISIATVSRALSGKADTVEEETRKAIFEAVERYGYKKRKSIGKSIAFVIDEDTFNLSSNFYASIISGIEEALIHHKYYFQFHSINKKKFDLTRINLNFNDLAGLIMVGVYHDDFVLKLKHIGIPIVLLDYYIPTEDIPAILIDNTDGILKACKYLAALGHRRVAYLSGDSVETSAQERLHGYQRALKLYNLIDDPELVVEDCKSRIDEGFQSTNIILSRPDLPTAILAYNDIIAVGAMDAIKQRGFSIPKDISVIGFDDITLASEVNPALTTIHVPKRTMGGLAVKRLLEYINGKNDPVQKMFVPTRLVIRATVTPPSKCLPSNLSR
ncbi:MAG: LacI family DNA-binding transcriptional regulator [Spirochaetota bacterium]